MAAPSIASPESAVRSLLELREAAKAATETFAARFLEERGSDWMKATAVSQTERGMRKVVTYAGAFSDVADPKALTFMSNIHDLVKPLDVVAAIGKAQGGWLRVIGRFVEGAQLLRTAASATPIGLAANLAIFIYEVSDDLCSLYDKKQEEQFALDYDLPLLELGNRINPLFRMLEQGLEAAKDVKAHLRSGPGMGTRLAALLAAGQYARRDSRPEFQRRLYEEAHRHFKARILLRSAMDFLVDQQLLAMAGANFANVLEVAFRQWSENPDQLLPPVPPQVSRDNRRQWNRIRPKVLTGYEKRFSRAASEFQKTLPSLEGELFMVALICTGAAAYTSDAILPRYQRQGMLGTER